LENLAALFYAQVGTRANREQNVVGRHKTFVEKLHRLLCAVAWMDELVVDHLFVTLHLSQRSEARRNDKYDGYDCYNNRRGWTLTLLLFWCILLFLCRFVL
jgi:hypothetical protein